MSKKQGVYLEIADKVLSKLPADQRQDYRIQDLQQFAEDTEQNYEQVISLGVEATRAAMIQQPATPKTAALLTRSALEALERAYPSSAPPKAPIFLDQPPERLLALGSLLSPKSKSAAVLMGPSSVHFQEELEDFAAELGLDLDVALIDTDSNPIALLSPLIRENDFLVVLPDRQSINQSAARWVLQLSYRYRKPVVAYSKKYAVAGATASAYLSSDDISDQLATQLANGKPEPRYSIFINESVAGSLNLQVPDIELLTIELERLLNGANNE